MRAEAQPGTSILATNLGIAHSVVAAVWPIGTDPFLAVQLPLTLMASTAGV